MDFDELFNILFYIVIIGSFVLSAIFKKKKKSDTDTSSSEEADAKPKWKQTLEDIIEDIKDEIEYETEPEPVEPYGRRQTNWEDTAFERHGETDEYTDAPDHRIRVQSPLSMDDPEAESDKGVFQPTCLKCDSPMKDVRHLGIEKQKGLIYCDICGERHKYNVAYEELTLTRTNIPAGYRGSIKSKYQIQDTRRDKMSSDGYVSHEGRFRNVQTGRVPHSLSHDELKSAVVWAEILGKPLGLRDF